MHTPTDFDLLNHAHPLPAQLSPRALEKQRLSALIARQAINVNLRELSCAHATSVSAVLTPKIRRSPFNEEVTVSHLDLAECWKGLSHSQATELLMWYKFLHDSLQSEVRASLYDDLVEGLLQSEEAIDEVYLVPRMLEYLHSNRHRIIEISFVGLIDSMMGMFHDRFPHAAAATSSNWSHFSGGLSLFLQNFLRIQDCFLDLPDGPCVLVDFNFTYADYLLTATGDVTWHLPDVRFLNLSSSRSSGEEYRITPFMLKELHSPASPPDCDDYVDHVSYTLPRSSLGFAWDPMKQCFRAVVPSCGDGELHTTATVLSAAIITPFPEHVQFERHSRWSIKLVIAPSESNCRPSIEDSNENVKLDDFDKHKSWTTQSYVSRTKTHTDSRSPSCSNILRKVFRSKADLTSRQKRKVSKSELVDVGFDIKRRRHGVAPEAGDEAAHQTHSDHKDEESKQEWWCEKDGAYADDGHSNAAHPPAAQCQACSPATSSRTGYVQPEQLNSSMPSFEVGPLNSNNSVSNSAIEQGCNSLEQQRIQHNYREFAELRLYKDAGIMSPVSEGERMAFENIFLEDGEAWSPVTDGSIVDLDTVMGEL